LYIVWPHRARVTHVRCLDGVWLHLFPYQLEAASAKAQPDQHAFHLVLQALQRLQALAQEQGASVLVMFQPSKEETYLPLLGNTVPDLQHALQEALAQHGIVMLDLTPIFRHQAAIAPQHRRPDGEGMRRRGHRAHPMGAPRIRVVPAGYGITGVEVGKERRTRSQADLPYGQRHEAMQLVVRGVAVPRAVQQRRKRPRHVQSHFGIGHDTTPEDVVIPPRCDPGGEARRGPSRSRYCLAASPARVPAGHSNCL
jgi:hypothetical protein